MTDPAFFRTKKIGTCKVKICCTCASTKPQASASYLRASKSGQRQHNKVVFLGSIYMTNLAVNVLSFYSVYMSA